jgi:hypothetical protein
MIDVRLTMDQYRFMEYRISILGVAETGITHDERKSHAGAHHDEPQGHHEIPADYLSRSRAADPLE